MFFNVHPTNTAITTSIINFPHNFPENGTEMIFSFPYFSFLQQNKIEKKDI